MNKRRERPSGPSDGSPRIGERGKRRSVAGQAPVRRAKAILAELEPWLIREQRESRREGKLRSVLDTNRQWFFGYMSAMAAVREMLARIRRKGSRAANSVITEPERNNGPTK